MHEPTVLLLLVVLLGLVFEFANGFHDAANAIATSVSTRVLSPAQAILLAGVLNFAGAVSGEAVALTVGKGLVEPRAVNQLTVVSALVAAILWDILTWYFGLPTSSSHALMAATVGAGMATAGAGLLVWSGIEKVLMGLVFSPILGLALGFVLMVALLWGFRKSVPSVPSRIFGRLQVLSAAYMAFSHGSNDGQKTMGIIATALFAYGASGEAFYIPWWVKLLCSLAIGVGTATGGWRIIRTLGTRLAHLRPINGFAAETSAATVIEAASRLGVPISTTHVIGSAIMGVGASRRLSAVRWGLARDIVLAWVLTLPACGLMGWLIYQGLSFLRLAG